MKTQHLSPPAEREDRHHRQVSCHGYARKDGLLDIEGELIDTKAYDFPSSTHGIISPRNSSSRELPASLLLRSRRMTITRRLQVTGFRAQTKICTISAIFRENLSALLKA